MESKRRQMERRARCREQRPSARSTVFGGSPHLDSNASDTLDPQFMGVVAHLVFRSIIGTP